MSKPWIDIELRPVITQLNKLGLKTTACCTGHNKATAYVAFDIESAPDVELSKTLLILRWDIPFKVSNNRGDSSPNLWRIDKKYIYKEDKDAIFVECQR